MAEATEKKVKKPVVAVADTDTKKKGGDEYLYAVGRRKTATASVRVYKKGEGKITINDKELNKYFDTSVQQDIVKAPMVLVGQADKLDVTVHVSGGGKMAQSEAVRHGISNALINLNANFRKPLKKADFLTRDARKKERKKPGLKRARRAPQWTKR